MTCRLTSADFYDPCHTEAIVYLLDAYARDYAVSAEEGVAAERIVPLPGGGFRVVTSAGEAESRFVVLATGSSAVPRLPDGEALLGAG